MFDELDLDDALVSACQEMGYSKPTSIQQLVIPPAMDAKDILACAPTGTGKTAAFCYRRRGFCSTTRAVSPEACGY